MSSGIEEDFVAHDRRIVKKIQIIVQRKPNTYKEENIEYIIHVKCKTLS